jgi:hypothetical protein
MTPMAARQQKGITAGYVGRPRELNLGRQLGLEVRILCGQAHSAGDALLLSCGHQCRPG